MLRRIITGLAAASLLWGAQANGDSAAEATASPIVVLVAGASGRTGRHTVAQLRAQGITVRAMTRNIARAQKNVSADYDWVEADVGRPATLPAALRGVTHVIGAMAASSRDPSTSPEEVDHMGVVNLTDAAKAAGVERIVLISSMAVTRTTEREPGHMRNLLEAKLRGEDYLRASGIAYTVIRPGGLDMSPAGEDVLHIEQGDGDGYGMLSREDLARVVVECLTHPAVANKTFEITGGKRGDPNTWQATLKDLR
jgi:uncharacterized protein YbjT (DUF2867 family)